MWALQRKVSQQSSQIPKKKKVVQNNYVLVHILIPPTAKLHKSVQEKDGKSRNLIFHLVKLPISAINLPNLREPEA